MWNTSEEILTTFPTSENWTRWELGPLRDDSFFFESIDEDYWYTAQQQNWWIPGVITVAYWVVTYTLEGVMKNKKPLGLQNVMIGYNTLIALFSIFATWRMSTTLFPVLFSGPGGFYRSVCVRFTITEKEVFWMISFTWSKVFHFLDTIFCVFRKKPIQFMQMYHHSIVVLVPQAIIPFGEPILSWWGLTNMMQHSITYTYFTLKAMKIKIPPMVPKVILIIEILQMLAGLGTGVYTVHVLRNGGQCVRHPTSIFVMNFVYVTILLLVVRMAYEHFTKQAIPNKDKPN